MAADARMNRKDKHALGKLADRSRMALFERAGMSRRKVSAMPRA